MDTIKLHLVEHSDLELRRLDYSAKQFITENNLTVVKVSVQFNDETPIIGIFNAGEVLAGVTFKQSEFNLYTCSCGVPECAGYFHPVINKQDLKNKTVSWTLNKDEYRCQKNSYIFDKTQFDIEFSELNEKLLNPETFKIVLYDSLVIDECCDDDNKPFVGSFELIKDNLSEWIAYCSNRMQKELNYLELLDAELNKFNLSKDSKITISFKNDITNHSEVTTLESFICGCTRVYNWSLSLNFEKALLKLMIKTIANKDFDLITKIAFRHKNMAYENSGLIVVDRIFNELNEQLKEEQEYGLISFEFLG